MRFIALPSVLDCCLVKFRLTNSMYFWVDGHNSYDSVNKVARPWVS